MAVDDVTRRSNQVTPKVLYMSAINNNNTIFYKCKKVARCCRPDNRSSATNVLGWSRYPGDVLLPALLSGTRQSVTRISTDSLEKMADGEGYLSKKKTLNILKISVAKTRGTWGRAWRQMGLWHVGHSAGIRNVTQRTPDESEWQQSTW